MDNNIFGLECIGLPEGWTPLEAVVVVKCLAEDGSMALAHRTTSGLTSWEAVGMLDITTQTITSDVVFGEYYEED